MKEIWRWIFGIVFFHGFGLPSFAVIVLSGQYPICSFSICQKYYPWWRLCISLKVVWLRNAWWRLRRRKTRKKYVLENQIRKNITTRMGRQYSGTFSGKEINEQLESKLSQYKEHIEEEKKKPKLPTLLCSLHQNLQLLVIILSKMPTILQIFCQQSNQQQHETKIGDSNDWCPKNIK